jgi:SAM-dependent methyltransferase
MSAATALFLLLRAAHVLLAALWVGSVAFISFFLMPAFEESGAAAGPVMGALLRRKLPVFMAAIGGTTVLTGFYLYYRFTGGFDPALSGSMGAGCSAWRHRRPCRVIIGAPSSRNVKKMGTIGARLASAPDAERAALAAEWRRARARRHVLPRRHRPAGDRCHPDGDRPLRARGARREARGCTMNVAVHLGIDLREYDARIRTFIPAYEEMLETAAITLKTVGRTRRPVVVDVGIGTGALSAACLDAVPGARVIGIDEDEGMLAGARARLGRRLTSAVHDSFERAAIPSCDAVVASLALHHIPTSARRLRLFRRIRAALRPGGALISVDCHPASSSHMASADRAAWLEHLEQAYAPSEARGFLRTWAREDRYSALPDELALLRRAGFIVDVPWRRHAFAVIAAAR